MTSWVHSHIPLLPKTVLFVCREINRADILGRYDCLGSGLDLCVCLVMTGIGLGACVCFGGLCSLFRQNSSSSFCLSISLFRLTAWRGTKTLHTWKWTKAKWISSSHFHRRQKMVMSIRPTNLDLPFAIASQRQVVYNLWGGCVIILESILLDQICLNWISYSIHTTPVCWPSKLTNHFFFF